MQEKSLNNIYKVKPKVAKVQDLSIFKKQWPPPTDEVGTSDPGVAPGGDVSPSSSGLAVCSSQPQRQCAPLFLVVVLSLLTLLTLFRNSAETTDTSLDCRCSPDLFASRRPLGLLFLSVLISPPQLLSPWRVSVLAEGASTGLQGAFQSFIQVLVFKDLGQPCGAHTHTHKHTLTLVLTHISEEMHRMCQDNIEKEGELK